MAREDEAGRKNESESSGWRWFCQWTSIGHLTDVSSAQDSVQTAGLGVKFVCSRLTSVFHEPSRLPVRLYE